MEFILSPQFIEKLKDLKTNYESKKNIKNLSEQPRPYAVSTFFGATDVDTRYEQIIFLSGLCKFLDRDYGICNEAEPLTDDTNIEARLLQDQKRLSAIRCLVTACTFIQSRNSSSSTLNKLISEALGISDANLLDQESLACCFKSTRQFLKNGELSDSISAFLTANQFPPLNIDTYQEFTEYNNEKAASKMFSKFPVTNMMYPIFVNPLQTVGYASGAIVGELLTRSTCLMSANYKITAALGGGAYMLLGAKASAGIFFMAPTLAENFIRNYLTIAMAWLCGNAAGLVGAAFAYSIGISADISWKIVMGSGQYFYDASFATELENKVSGMSLIDGQLVDKGIKLQLQADEVSQADDTPNDLQRCEVIIERNNTDDVEASHEKTDDQLPIRETQPFMEELKSRISAP